MVDIIRNILNYIVAVRKVALPKIFHTELGEKILNDEMTLKDLAEVAEQLGKPSAPISGNQEGLQTIMNQLLFG